MLAFAPMTISVLAISVSKKTQRKLNQCPLSTLEAAVVTPDGHRGRWHSSGGLHAAFLTEKQGGMRERERERERERDIQK